jgi:hypothetical protein
MIYFFRQFSVQLSTEIQMFAGWIFFTRISGITPSLYLYLYEFKFEIPKLFLACIGILSYKIIYSLTPPSFSKQFSHFRHFRHFWHFWRILEFFEK